MPLNAGILMIGSLFWDPEGGRPGWRNARLNMTAAQSVAAPIRYGRLSGSRGNSYTMVFSRLCPSGSARLVPCSHSISTTQDLIAEAEFLWKAEQPRAKAHRIAADWGCVALLCDPNRPVPEELLKGWAERVRDEPDYGKVTQTTAEGLLIDANGNVMINWPRCLHSGAPVHLDLLLMTANDPQISTTNPDYPNVGRIAGAWNAAEPKYAEYFWNNTDNGITTFQDDEILAVLRPHQQERP